MKNIVVNNILHQMLIFQYNNNNKAFQHQWIGGGVGTLATSLVSQTFMWVAHVHDDKKD